LQFMSWGAGPTYPLGGRDGAADIDDYIGQLRRALEDGFTTVWSPQLWREPDLLTVLALALHEVDDITVGTGVIPIQMRHPSVLAQQALTVSAISGGRLKLGVGMTHPMISEGMWGIPWERHARRLNEYLDGLVPLLHGEEAATTGQFTTTRLALAIRSAPPPPVYLAALGPRLLEITARRAAGTITWMTGARTLETYVIPALATAGDGKRRAEVVAGFPVCVTDDLDGARAFGGEVLAIYGAQPSYRAMLDREGLKDPVDTAIIGGEDAVSEQLEQLAALGIDEVAAYVLTRTSDEDQRTRTLLGGLARTGVPS
jgi:5,10-methylenetetrahydromethanopterin reductase